MSVPAVNPDGELRVFGAAKRNRPERRNALTSNMYFGIRRAVDRVNASRRLQALVITGTGDVFAPDGAPERLAPTTDEGARDILRSAPVSGEEVIEGFQAFVEKRDPAWIPEAFRKH